jgi:hypothetical protein
MESESIELRAEEGNYLRMSSFELFSDGSGGRCRLEVQSGEIFLRTNLWFDLAPLRNFVSSMSSIAEHLTGTAWLGLEYEPSRISIAADGRGHMKVAGELFIGLEQEVKFVFGSDQSFAPPFIDSLKVLLERVPNV